MEPNQNDLLHETHELAKDNNRMLHSMRRRAFWGGVLKFIVWFVLLVVAPLWLYSTYLAPIVQSFQQTVTQVQDTGTKTQEQINSYGDAVKQAEAKFLSLFQWKK